MGKPRRVLVIGAGGQLGRALSKEFQQGHELLQAVYRSARPDQWTADLADAAGTIRLLDQLRPEWILIAGAFCNVDLCETEAERCHRVNADGPRAVAEWARTRGATAVYYSTDHVFDAAAPSYGESDPVRPLNVYAASKADGEAAVRQLLPESHLILRTSGLYGPDVARKNFVIRLVDRLRAGEKVPVPLDQWGSPTYTEDLARVSRFLLERGLRGIYHATGPDFLTRIDLSRQVCKAFGLNEDGIVPMTTAQLKQPARRPLSPRLRTDKLAATGAPRFRAIPEGLEALKEFLLESAAPDA